MHRRISALFLISAGLLSGAYAGSILHRTGDTVALRAPAQVTRAAKADRVTPALRLARVERRGKADRYRPSSQLHLAAVSRATKRDRLPAVATPVAIARADKRDVDRETLAAVVRQITRRPEPAVAAAPEPLNIIPAAARVRTALVAESRPVHISKAELRWLEPGYLR